MKFFQKLFRPSYQNVDVSAFARDLYKESAPIASIQGNPMIPDHGANRAFDHGAREMCGGCGKMKTPQELEACAGEVCHDYVMGARGSDMINAQVEGFGMEVQIAPQRKIPIGYKGHLHTDKK